MRVFVAIELPSHLKSSLFNLISKLSNIGARISWVKKDSIHLTLKFLGEVEERRIEEISERLKFVLSRTEAFKIKVEGVGWFPENSTNPRVLWVGVKYPEQLKNLWKDIEKKMEEIGFKPEERDFSPHITIGRVKGGSGIRKVMEMLKEVSGETFGEFEVKEIILFQSILKSDGAEYFPVKRFFLGLR
ncbi:MAG: RNA 2',3'-cyclic phosphodiesterase [Candidatus Aminicenantia bacterium]